MKLTESYNEDALDLLADVIEPVTKILSDEMLAKSFQQGKNLKGVQIALKKYKPEIIEVLARLDGVEPKDYKGNIITMTKQLLDIVNDPELASFFSPVNQQTSVISSGNVTEATEEKEQ